MAAAEAAHFAISAFSFRGPVFSKCVACPKPLQSVVKPRASALSLRQFCVPLFPGLFPDKRARASGIGLCLCAASDAAGAATAEVESGTAERPNVKRKLFVFNLPQSFSAADVKDLFGRCGTVTRVETIKHESGKNRGFAFVTMASGEEAQAVIDEFDSQEVSGRLIRVEFAKRLKKRSPSLPSPTTNPGETRHKLYVSNLQWKVRSKHLKEFFSAKFNPVSARVVFDSASGRAAGYGFVSFATKEEAEEAVSALDGKDLMGRPLRLKFTEKNVDGSETEKDEQKIIESHSEV